MWTLEKLNSDLLLPSVRSSGIPYYPIPSHPILVYTYPVPVLRPSHMNLSCSAIARIVVSVQEILLCFARTGVVAGFLLYSLLT
jgi:hypothetical protein